MIPANAYCLFRDGNQWCCVGTDFINLQESIAGFGDGVHDAITAYQDAVIHSLSDAIERATGVRP